MFVVIFTLIHLLISSVCSLPSVTKVDLQDKDFLTALAQHAQTLAKIILNRSDSGFHLAEDAQVSFELSVQDRLASNFDRISVCHHRKSTKSEISAGSTVGQRVR